MPLYQFKCKNCQEEFEVIKKFSDESVTTCPKCKSDFVEKQVSGSSFKLKGQWSY